MNYILIKLIVQSALNYKFCKQEDMAEKHKQFLGDEDHPNLEEEKVCHLRFDIGREGCIQGAFEERML